MNQQGFITVQEQAHAHREGVHGSQVRRSLVIGGGTQLKSMHAHVFGLPGTRERISAPWSPPL